MHDEKWAVGADGYLPDGTPLYFKTARHSPYASLQLELYDILMNYQRSMEEDDD